MTPGNLEVVRSVYAGWAEGDFSASLPLFDDHITLVIDAGVPEGDTYLGLEGVREYMSRFLDSWEWLRMAGESFEEIGDTVLVEVTQTGVGRGSGAPGEVKYFQLWTFRGKKVVYLETILSEQTAREAVKREV